MAEKTSPVAAIALCVSIGTACFSIYQWWNSERQTRINAAVDISQKYFREPPTQTIFPGLALMRGEILDDAGATSIYRNLNENEYLAYLINRDRVAFDYLAPSLKCHMYWTSLLSEKLKSQRDMGEEYSELAAFGQKVANSCIPFMKVIEGTLGESHN